MAIIKDLILTTLFLCMFGVLLLFVTYQTELRSSAIQNDITINSQVRIIQDNIELSLRQTYKINYLKNEITDLHELLLITQKKEDMLEDEVKELKSDVSRVERSKRKLIYKLEQLEKEIKKTNDFQKHSNKEE